MTDGQNTNQEELRAQFDEWAGTYDRDVGTPSDRFPFAGYAQTLLTVWEKARAVPGDAVLDLGVGTGNLSRLFVQSGCQVLGADFSSAMLAKTGEKLPQLALVQADLTAEEWPEAMSRRFDHIVSNYVFHEFPLAVKLRILEHLAENNLRPGSRIIIGDITFPTTADLERVRREQADDWEEEFYWVEDETRAALEAAGWTVDYHQISFCAGIYVLTPPD